VSKLLVMHQGVLWRGNWLFRGGGFYFRHRQIPYGKIKDITVRLQLWQLYRQLGLLERRCRQER
jgi:hypothetical protein